MTTDRTASTAAEVSSTTDTIPVRETHRFDVSALERYMAGHVEGFKGPVTVSQFQGGQSNPTYRLSSPGGEYVLRRKPPGKLLPSAHAVDREYRIMTALAWQKTSGDHLRVEPMYMPFPARWLADERWDDEAVPG